MAMRDTPTARDPLAGVELRQAARFAMTLVTEQAQVCQRLHPPGRPRVPRARRGVRRPHLPDRPGGPPARTHRRTAAARADRRPWPTPTADPDAAASATAKAERLQAAAADTIAVPGARRRGRPSRSACCSTSTTCSSARSRDADRRVAGLLDGELARRLQTIPGVGPSIVATLISRDRRHRALRRLRPAPRVRRRPPAERSSGREGREPRDRLAHEQGRQRSPPGGGLPDGRRRRPSRPGSSPPPTPASGTPGRRR